MTNPYQPPPAPVSKKKEKPTVLRTLAKISLFLALVGVYSIIRKIDEPLSVESAAERNGRLLAIIVVPAFFVVLAVIFFAADRRRKARLASIQETPLFADTRAVETTPPQS